VQERTAGLLALKNLFARNLGEMLPVDELRAFEADDVPELVGDPNRALAIQSTIRVGERLDEEIDGLEKAAYQAARDRPELEILLSIPGVGRRIGLTILYETGDIRLPVRRAGGDADARDRSSGARLQRLSDGAP
jgi:transposase